ncbi:BT_3987 domain-containing protein [Proteiniphilum sp. X52]|uniref:BT_3987 domain-containing protein n=1 Tax=Proteiniphilum sp. X52 TaxID=2382159 RepID=UPI0013141682|nr:DUF1735 domain-containing protein [Proteiniphilum sp. X52]
MMAFYMISCNGSYTDFGEQYKKILYIVNSDDLLYENEHFYHNEKDSITVSVYCSGSESIGRDVSVTLELTTQALDSFNEIRKIVNPDFTKKVLLPESHYQFPKKKAVIRKGEQYGTLKIPFSMNGLEVDSNYVLPLKLISNDQGYEINPKLNTIIYEIKMMNGFSGEYSGSSTVLPGTVRSVQPVLKAISSNSVRMPIHDLVDEKEFLDTHYMVLTIADDSTQVSISAWRNAQIRDFGESSYDKTNKSFELNYAYTDQNGNELVIKEKIRDLSVTDEEEY